MTLAELQSVIAATYGARDAERGIPSTVAWIAEEVGELAQAVRKGTRAQQEHEISDVLAWGRLARQPARHRPHPRPREVCRGLPQVPRRPLCVWLSPHLTGWADQLT
jgi:hypothetical protein